VKRRVGFSLPALAFLLAFAEVLAAVCQDAFFLKHNSEQRIPLAIAGGGICAALSAVLFTRLLGRRSARFLASAMCVGMAGCLIPLALWTRHPTEANTFVQYVFLELAQFVVAAAAWSFIQAPLDPAGARRVLPLTMLSFAMGGMTAGVLIPLWLQRGPTSGLLFGAAAGWIAAAALIARSKHGSDLPLDTGGARGIGVARVLFGDAFSRRIVLLLSLLVLSLLMLEFQFKARIQNLYDEKGIAILEARLLGAAAILGLPVALGFSDRFLARAGVHWGLMVLPLLLALGLAFFLSFNHLGVIAAALLAVRTLKPTLHEPAEGCLIGALDPRTRGRFKMMLDGIVIPSVSVIGALGLLFLAGGSASTSITVVAIGFALLYSVLALRVKPAYAKALGELLARTRFDLDAGPVRRGWIPVLDATALQAVLRSLDEGTGMAAEMAEEILREFRFPEERRAMLSRLRHQNPRVRAAALRWFLRESDIPPESAGLSPTEPGLTETERALRLALRLRAGPPEARVLLDAWSASENPLERQSAAQAAAWAGLGTVLCTLARDSDPRVRRTALSFGPESADPAVLEVTVRALDDERVAGDAVTALVRWGPQATPLLKRRVAEVTGPGRSRTLRVLGFLRDPEAVSILWDQARRPETADDAVVALGRLRTRWPEGVVTPPDFQETLRDPVRLGRLLLEIATVLPKSLGGRSLIRREVNHQLWLSLERAARRLQLLAPAREIWTVFLCLCDPKAPDRETAMELLRLCLPRGELLDQTARLFEGRVDAPEIGDLEEAKRWIAEHGDVWLRSAAHHDLQVPFDGEDPMKPVLDRVLFLREVALFSALDNRDLVLLAEVAEEVELPADTTVCAAGGLGDALWVIREGVLRVSAKGKEIARLARGEVVGEIAVLEGSRRTADVTTILPTRLLRFPAEVFRGVLEGHPPIMWALVRQLIRRIKLSTSGQIETLYGMAESAGPQEGLPGLDLGPRGK